MTYLADFYMGRIIKDTAALVEPSVLSTLHREFSLPGFTPALPCYWCTPQILCLLTACWHRGDLGEADCACSWVFQKEQLALEGPCLPLLVGLCESITVHSIRLNQISLVSSRTSGGQQKFGWLGFIREKLPVLSSSNSIVHRTSFKFQGKIRGFKRSVPQFADLRHNCGYRKVWNECFGSQHLCSGCREWWVCQKCKFSEEMG